ncbi:MAG: zf-HC2 domain-containing protein [Planctomycetota bacterium]|nr:zf-HC2 domain-containing protein [Planctomycetota bacterium]
MKTDPASCPEASELVAFSRGALDAVRARVVEAHVASCANCRESAQDEQDSGTFGRMLRDWRSRMTPEDRSQTIDRAARSIEAARRDGPTPL